VYQNEGSIWTRESSEYAASICQKNAADGKMRVCLIYHPKQRRKEEEDDDEEEEEEAKVSWSGDGVNLAYIDY